MVTYPSSNLFKPDIKLSKVMNIVIPKVTPVAATMVWLNLALSMVIEISTSNFILIVLV